MAFLFELRMRIKYVSSSGVHDKGGISIHFEIPPQYFALFSDGAGRIIYHGSAAIDKSLSSLLYNLKTLVANNVRSKSSHN